MNPYDSVLFAKYLLALSYEKKQPLNMTKLQKLMYILYGYYLAKDNNRQIVDESPRIWPFGPVFPKVHKKVETTKLANITDPLFQQLNSDEDLNTVMGAVIDKYAPFTATQLSNWSHMEGSPWDKTVKEFGEKWNTIIPNQFIVEYFSRINTI
jgi:uncharacterized phage-associated protein